MANSSLCCCDQCRPNPKQWDMAVLFSGKIPIGISGSVPFIKLLELLTNTAYVLVLNGGYNRVVSSDNLEFIQIGKLGAKKERSKRKPEKTTHCTYFIQLLLGIIGRHRNTNDSKQQPSNQANSTSELAFRG